MFYTSVGVERGKRAFRQIGFSHKFTRDVDRKINNNLNCILCYAYNILRF